MSTSEPNMKIEKACVEALEKFKKVNHGQFSEVQSKLEWVLGSYRNDGNPVGLYEVGGMALSSLKSLREEKPRQVAQKLIDTLESALKQQS